MILLLSILVPLVVGYGVTRLRQDEMAPLVWLIGLDLDSDCQPMGP